MKSAFTLIQPPVVRNPRHRAGHLGFTIIELLVVVTIIVVLLALLTPAMDRAIYQAELTVCASRQKAIATGAVTYAIDFNRWYPHRTILEPGITNRQPLIVAVEGRDDRPTMRDHIPLQALPDPLAGEYPITPEDTVGAGIVFSGYELWFGVHFPGHQGMKKIGDAFEWTDNFNSPVQTRRFRLLASDFDFAGSAERNINGHPDEDKILAPSIFRGPASYYTRWEENVPGVRGAVDMNYAYDDGGVSRMYQVTVNDERTAAVPYQSDALNWSVWLLQLPKQ